MKGLSISITKYVYPFAYFTWILIIFTNYSISGAMLLTISKMSFNIPFNF